jgi:hypothetical protein
MTGYQPGDYAHVAFPSFHLGIILQACYGF